MAAYWAARSPCLYQRQEEGSHDPMMLSIVKRMFGPCHGVFTETFES